MPASPPIKTMPSPSSHPVKAVLGPTNTGKTHLAVERLTAHASGMMGFPLRLLAREVYDRVVAIKGPAQVALVTGEERVMPPDARDLLGTMEALPVERDFAFVGIDEAQLGADPERGHVFTDRMLRARGREETMILGSASLAGLVRELVPEAEIVTRPRFSTLSYAGPMKLSRLPQRSAIVAFSSEEVYAIAEMLRRFAGGAAVVMRALSPRTRNAPFPVFEGGEVVLPAPPAPPLRRADEAVAPAETLGNRRLLVRRSLCDRRNAAPLRGRRRGGDGRAVPAHPQRAGRDVRGGRGRLSRRHRRDRHGAEPRCPPCRLRILAKIRRPPVAAADRRGNGANRRARRAPPAGRQFRLHRPAARRHDVRGNRTDQGHSFPPP